MPMLISFAIPFLLGNLLTALYNTVDSIIVGHLIGSAGFVAVTVGGKTLNLFTHISVSFATGGQVYIGQLEGAKHVFTVFVTHPRHAPTPQAILSSREI